MSTVSTSAAVLTCGFRPGRGDDERDARGLLVVRVLAPHAVVAEMPAVIAPEDDDGVLREAGVDPSASSTRPSWASM